jgi:general secretion pathway protein H
MIPGRQVRFDASTSRARGFTLIEILVVIVIIGIITAGVVLAVSVTGQDRQLEDESERLMALMNYAREQAELQTRELGLLLTDHSYQFLAFDPRRGMWAEVQEDDALRLRKLPQDLRVRLVVEAREVILNKPRPQDEQKRQPHLMIFSNGDLTEFELTLEREGTDRKLILVTDDQGNITTPEGREAAREKAKRKPT